MMSRLAQVGGTGLGTEVRPELLDDLVAQKPAAVGKGQQRDKLLRPASRPVALDDLPIVEGDPEMSEHLDANLARTRVHDAIFVHAASAHLQLSSSIRRHPFTYGRPTAAGGRERPMSPTRATSVST